MTRFCFSIGAEEAGSCLKAARSARWIVESIDDECIDDEGIDAVTAPCGVNPRERFGNRETFENPQNSLQIVKSFGLVT